MNPLDEFMFDDILVHERLRPQDRREVDAVIPEGVVADKGDEIGNASRHLLHHLRRDLAGHPFDLRQIAVVVDADVDQDGHVLLLQRIVRDDQLRQFHVGDQDEIAGQRPDLRVPPADVADVPLLAGVELQVVPHPDLLGCDDMESREKVRERVLEREGDGQPTDAEGRQDRGDGDPEAVEDDQPPHPVDDDPDDVLHDARHRQDRFDPFGAYPCESAQNVRRDQCHGKNGQDGQSLVGLIDEGFGKIR